MHTNYNMFRGKKREKSLWNIEHWIFVAVSVTGIEKARAHIWLLLVFLQRSECHKMLEVSISIWNMALLFLLGSVFKWKAFFRSQAWPNVRTTCSSETVTGKPLWTSEMERDNLSSVSYNITRRASFVVCLSVCFLVPCCHNALSREIEKNLWYICIVSKSIVAMLRGSRGKVSSSLIPLPLQLSATKAVHNFLFPQGLRLLS